MTLPTVVCVLRRGKEYTGAHVAALLEGVISWWPKKQPLRFVALTDFGINASAVLEANSIGAPRGVKFEIRKLRSSWPGWWAKMEIFSAEHDDLGDILYFDLDTMIIGPLDDIAKPRQAPVLLQDFYQPKKINTGMMYLPTGSRPDVYAGWLEMSAEYLKKLPGDGDYLDLLWRGKVGLWQSALPEQVVSYKVHCRQNKGQAPPRDARVICFHGRPRPWNTPLWTRDK